MSRGAPVRDQKCCLSCKEGGGQRRMQRVACDARKSSKEWANVASMRDGAMLSNHAC